VSEAPRAFILSTLFEPARTCRRSCYCTVPGCSQATAESKPWCPDHVLTHSPYAAAVHARMTPEPEGRTYVRACEDCGEEFQTKSKKSKRCRPCLKEMKSRVAKEWRARQREAS
jgi:hypothetical protein